MKPAVILFTTISFIIIITLLMIQNISNNDKLLIINNKDYSNTQALLIVHDLKNEIGKSIIDNKSNVDELTSSDSTNDFNYLKHKGVIVKFTIEEFRNKYNLNNILKNNNSDEIKNFFTKNDYDFENFKFFIEEYFTNLDEKNIEFKHNSQVNTILNQYKQYAQLKNVDILKNNFTHIKVDKASKYYRCILIINIHGEIYKSSFIYNINNLSRKNIEVSDFEITFI